MKKLNLIISGVYRYSYNEIKHFLAYKGPTGLTPFFRIVDDFQQMSNFEIWLGEFGKTNNEKNLKTLMMKKLN